MRPDIVFHGHIRYRNDSAVAALANSRANTPSDRLLGCMVGLAVGDILGCPVEGLSYRDIRARHGTVSKLVWPELGSHWRLPGLHSDDTQQALATLEACRLAGRKKSWFSGKSTADRVAERLASLFVEGLKRHPQGRFGCWRGTGANFREAVKGLNRQTKMGAWYLQCGQPSAGLGVAMRIAPVGHLLADVREICDMTSKMSAVTHADALAYVSACAVAIACRLLREHRSGRFRVSSFLNGLTEEVRFAENSLDDLCDRRLFPRPTNSHQTLTSTLIDQVQELIDAPPSTAIPHISRVAGRILGKQIHPLGGFGPTGVAACLYFLLNCHPEPVQPVLMAVNAGGDTDTTAAVVGALSGSLAGTAPFVEPARDLVCLPEIVSQVQDFETTDGGGQTDLIQQEIYFTNLEEDMRAGLHNHHGRRR